MLVTSLRKSLSNSHDMDKPVKKQKTEDVKVIKEGKAEILVTNKNVFYNPVQEFNRDLSIAILSRFIQNKLEDNVKSLKNKSVHDQNGVTILEAFSATGLRSIRYAREVKGVTEIIANDISAKAVEAMKENILHNSVENLVKTNCEDATMLMYRHRRSRFDAIDIDPYGCPSMFLDAAVQCVIDGGLLLVTATDMAVLAGNSPETCYVKYGAISLKSKACHEIALRILLQNVASHAGRYGRYIVPLLSISADFYIRVFVKIYTSQLKCKENASKTGILYQCTGCETLNVQSLSTKSPNGAYKLPQVPSVDQLCRHCNHKHHVGGPIWLGPLHDQGFVTQVLCDLDTLELETSKRIEGVLTMIREEIDSPLYYTLDRLMSIVKCYTPPMITFRSALLNAGYKVSYSHANKLSIKTDAPNNIVWDIVRAWEKSHPAKRDKLPADSPALAILTKASSVDVSFQLHPLANPISREKHLSRFQENPAENWGPGTRSKIMIDNQQCDFKKAKNQNKNTKKNHKQIINQANVIKTEDEEAANTESNV